MTRSDPPPARWTETALATGFLALASYIFSVVVQPFPWSVGRWLFFAFGPLLAVSVYCLGRSLGRDGDRAVLRCGVLLTIGAGILFSAMAVIQDAHNAFLRRLLADKPDLDREIFGAVHWGVNGVQLGIDVGFDVWISSGTALLALALWRYGLAGKLLAVSGVSAALAPLTLNTLAYPEPPAEAGLVDLGPVVGGWFLLVLIWLVVRWWQERRLVAGPAVAAAAVTAWVVAGVPIAAAQPAPRELAELFESGRLDEAAAAAEERLGRHSGDTQALLYLGRIELHEGDAKAASRWLEKTADSGNCAECQLWLGRAQKAQLDDTGNPLRKLQLARSVRAAYERAIALDPDSIAARESLYYFLSNAPAIAGGSAAEAERQMTEIELRDPRAARWIRASELYQAGDRAAARRVYEQILAIDPEDLDTQLKLAVVQLVLSGCAAARQSVQRARSAAPDDLRALYLIGRVAADCRKETAEGVAALSQYLLLPARPGLPGHDQALWRLGQIYEIRGRHAAATRRL